MTPAKHIYVLYSVIDKKARSILNFDFEEQADDSCWLMSNEKLAWLKIPKDNCSKLNLADVARIEHLANTMLQAQ